MTPLATASLRPPAPISTGTPCPAVIKADKTLFCVSLRAPSPLVSHPPAASTVGCYTGTTLDGRYVVENILGEGGMGIVYLARHKVIGKKVAVKVLRTDFAHDREIAERFLQEARAASSIGSPHIVDIADFGELDDGSTYIVMELLDGVSLSKLANAKKRLPLHRIIGIGRQIADGLAAAHARGIVHRDLKPENVFLVRRGSDPDFVKILDFGIAKVTKDATSKETRAGMLFGTPHYMSPEQAAGTPVDGRTDVYALGVILYELVSGRVPFDGDNMIAILTQHLLKNPIPLRTLVPDAGVPPALEAIILKAMSKQADQRYPTMEAMSVDLDKLLRKETPVALTEMVFRAASMFPPDVLLQRSAPAPVDPSPGRAAPPRVPMRQPRTPWGMYAGMTAILMCCGLVLGVFLQASSSTAQVTNSVVSAAAAPSTEKPKEEPVVPRSSFVLLATDPPDAHVFRAGIDLGTTPMTLEVPRAGEIVVEVRRSGYRARFVTLDGSESKTVIKLSAPERSAPVKVIPKKRAANDHAGEIINPWAAK
ncbi:MAG TPA: serine/threonine-protein kinase [Polyangiaceae bacterium]|nr:serine/threonine-protein kinase [Polyangiaceae bacterium]